MTLFRTTEPEAEPVSLAEIREHLRLDDDSQDGYLAGLIAAAREEVENSLGLALIDQNWRCTLDRLPRSRLVPLRRHPVREVLSVTVYGADGEASLVDPAAVQLDAAARPARLLFLTPLETRRAMNGIEIDFSAGFGEEGGGVPAVLRRALLMLVAHWYEFRLSFGARDQPVSFPDGYERLVSAWRPRRL